jgi:hypothetical protein
MRLEIDVDRNTYRSGKPSPKHPFAEEFDEPTAEHKTGGAYSILHFVETAALHFASSDVDGTKE